MTATANDSLQRQIHHTRYISIYTYLPLHTYQKTDDYLLHTRPQKKPATKKTFLKFTGGYNKIFTKKICNI
jgi:hypothetical protein